MTFNTAAVHQLSAGQHIRRFASQLSSNLGGCIKCLLEALLIQNRNSFVTRNYINHAALAETSYSQVVLISKFNLWKNVIKDKKKNISCTL